MLYLDSSALVKLVQVEPESAALRAYLTRRPGATLASSALARVEVVRAARAREQELVPTAVRVCEEIDLLPVSLDLLREAADLVPRRLRSLDATHLASALRLRPVGLEALVTYDVRLADAARAAGLPVVAPA